MSDGALFVSLFLTGLAGSLHCVGMCGPILLGFCQAFGAGRRFDFVYYHAGRLWTYGLLGFVAGWAGSRLAAGSAVLGWQRPLSVALALAVIAAGAVALGLVPGLRFDLSPSGTWLPSLRRTWLAALVREPRRSARLLLGSAMGFLPCGLVYAALLVTVTLPTPLHGAVGMLCFGAGTLPALTAVVAGARFAPRWLRAGGSRLAAGVLIATGLFMLARAVLVHAPQH